MVSLANVMVRQIKSSLKIKSPSRVGMALGAFFGKGVAIGVGNHEDTVRAASSRLANAAASVPMRAAGVSAANGSGSGTVYQFGDVKVQIAVDDLDGLNTAVDFFQHLATQLQTGQGF